jgi:DNA polymerase-3 subunit delta'
MKFSDISGNDSVKERIKAMIDNDRLPHALLLEGPAGIGKFAMARATAQYLHCTNKTNGDSCGHCPSCIQHQSFNHIDTIYSFPILKSAGGAVSDDFTRLWKEFMSDSPYMNFELWQKMLGNPNGQPVIYVDESQEIIRKLSFTSHGSSCKVVIMWLPEKMNVQCANKLLKLIEEPLPGVKLLFVSNNSGGILPTIYSRLQRIEMKRLSDDEVAAYLQRKYNLDATDAIAEAHMAEGSIILADKNHSNDSENHQFLEYFQQLMRLAYQRKIAMLKKWSVDIAGLGREQSARFCDYCYRQTRENFISNLHVAGLNYLNREEQAFSRNFSPFINERNVEQISAVFNKAKQDILANGNGKIIFFDVAVKIILLLKN